MKTKQVKANSKHMLRKSLWRRPRAHDPMLVLNMVRFNFTDGWSRTFSREQYARFTA